MKIVTIVGARPQFIKAATVSRAIQQWNQRHGQTVEEKIIHTGQHYDANMSEVFFEEMQIPRPSRNLNIGSGTHARQTAPMLIELEEIFLEEKPDMVLIYGDTNSTLAGALAASKLHIPLIHVEAGLRSFLKRMPEEQNRIVADHLASVLFCPTQAAVDNLGREGFSTQLPATVPTSDFPAVVNVGDVMFDSVLFYADHAHEQDYLREKIGSAVETPYLLVTIHRAENTDHPDRLESILVALNELSKTTQILWPVHPRTQKILSQQPYLQSLTESFCMIEPVTYREMIWLLMHSAAVCSDSGGLQKEAYFLQKPSIIMKDRTEWVETVEIGWSVTVGADGLKIQEECQHALVFSLQSSSGAPFSSMGHYQANLYGDGHSAERIVECLCRWFNGN